MEGLKDLRPAEEAVFCPIRQRELLRELFPALLRRELAHAGIMAEGTASAARLPAWVEVG
jgi:hypothetical protein